VGAAICHRLSTLAILGVIAVSLASAAVAM
jgi:hypothetical protein